MRLEDQRALCRIPSKMKVLHSLAGHTLHLRRKGLVSCLYATCAAAARSAAPIKSLHVMVLCNI